MSAQEILRVIETVSPDDTEKLNEIDALVFCFLENRKLENYHVGLSIINDQVTFKWKSYTRSRDALKAIRPDGWFVKCSGSRVGYEYAIWQSMLGKKFVCPLILTEELAELWVILCAIDFEREVRL